MYEIIDSANNIIASAPDKHEIDTAWDVLTKNDDELAKIYTDASYLKNLTDKYRKPVVGSIRLAQVWKTFTVESGITKVNEGE